MRRGIIIKICILGILRSLVKRYLAEIEYLSREERVELIGKIAVIVMCYDPVRNDVFVKRSVLLGIAIVIRASFKSDRGAVRQFLDVERTVGDK